jgi:hypothetical protein
VPSGSAAGCSIAFRGGFSSAGAGTGTGADALLPLAHRRRACVAGRDGRRRLGVSRLRWDERFLWARVYTWELVGWKWLGPYVSGNGSG